MTTRQFIVVIAAIIIGLLGALLVEHYRMCQEKGGIYCMTGPGIGGSRAWAPR